MFLRHGVEGILSRSRYGARPAPDRIPAARAPVPGAMNPDPSLVTGASGYVGGRLVDELLRRGRPVRTLVRDPSRRPQPSGADVRSGDAVSARGLPEALDGVRTAYYLIHSMGSEPDFAARDRQAAVNFGEAAAAAGVERVIYLGGLGPTGD